MLEKYNFSFRRKDQSHIVYRKAVNTFESLIRDRILFLGFTWYWYEINKYIIRCKVEVQTSNSYKGESFASNKSTFQTLRVSGNVRCNLSSFS